MKAYPIEIRTRVVNYVKCGGAVVGAMEKYEVGRDTVYRWLRLDNAGALEPKKSWGRWRKIDPEKLRAQTHSRCDDTLEELGQELGASASGIFRALRRLKITLKKNRQNTSKKMILTAGFSRRKSKA